MEAAICKRTCVWDCRWTAWTTGGDCWLGWIGSGDTEQQLELRFPTKEAAIAYARREGIDYRVFDPHRRIVVPKSYADNFIRKT